MKKKIIIILAAAAVLAGGTVAWFMAAGSQKKTSFLFTKIDRGNLESTVSCTGTLEFLHTENVASQVAGTVKTLYTDYNRKVAKGQVLAELDSTMLRLDVQDAENTLKKNKILLEQAQKDYKDTKELFESNFKSSNEFQETVYSLHTAELNVSSSKTALEIARLNLQYTTIRSPLTGVVIQRNVSVGDAVTANNTSSPMFIVASDIRQMQILASVDESDISKIKVGQKVYFTVQSYQDREFNGKVSQIRLATTTVQNVVTYTVVVAVNNPDNALLPGMTATLDLVAESRTNVLKIPSSAFKFTPSATLMRQSFNSARKGMTNTNRSAGLTNSSRKRQNMTAPPAGGMTNVVMLWTTNENGIRPVMVKKGFSDGVNVEIMPVSGKDVLEGMAIITGIETNKAKSSNKNGNRSLMSGPGFGGGPGGPPPH